MALTQIKASVVADDAIVAAKIADDAIGADQLAASAVVTASIVDDAVTSAKIADNSVDIARLNVTDGTTGQVLTTNGSGTLAFATVGGAYSDWTILTTTANLAAKGQYIFNHASTAFTVTLPAGSAEDTVVICNAGAATVTIARTSNQKINSATEDGTLPQGNSVQLVYVDSAIGWFAI